MAFARKLKINNVCYASFSQSYSKTDADERTQGHSLHKTSHGTNSCVTAAPGGTLLPDFPKPSKLNLPEDVPNEKVREACCDRNKQRWNLVRFEYA